MLLILILTNSVEPKSSMVCKEIIKLHEAINQSEFENETNMEKMNSFLNKKKNTKLKFKKDIDIKIKFLENEIKMLQGEKEELQDRINRLHLYLYLPEH